MTTNTTQAALGAYLAERDAALAIIDRIHDVVENHDAAPADRIDWGHAGGMASIRSDLQAISDRLFSEGEYSAGAS